VDAIPGPVIPAKPELRDSAMEARAGTPLQPHDKLQRGSKSQAALALRQRLE